MNKFLILCAVVFLTAGHVPAHAQSSPGIFNGQVPTAGQWNSWFASKQDIATGFPTGPGSSIPGDIAVWGATYPSLSDGGPIPTVAPGDCITVVGGRAYTISLTGACKGVTGPGSAVSGHVVTWGTYPATADGGALPSVVNGGCTTVSGGPAYSVSVVGACVHNITPPRGYIDGLLLSTAGSVQTFTVASGEAADTTSVAMMVLTSSLTKTLGSVWAVGPAAGCLDTGTAAVSTWYTEFLIAKPDLSAIDILCSTSVSTPAMPTGYTLKRRIGAMKTTAGTANLTTFLQLGDTFYWSVPTNDVAAVSLSTASVNFAMNVPLGVSVTAKVRGSFVNASAGTSVVVTSPLFATPVAGTPAGETTAIVPNTSRPAPFTLDILTDTTQHVTGVASAATSTITMDTYGWIDPRGRNN